MYKNRSNFQWILRTIAVIYLFVLIQVISVSSMSLFFTVIYTVEPRLVPRLFKTLLKVLKFGWTVMSRAFVTFHLVCKNIILFWKYSYWFPVHTLLQLFDYFGMYPHEKRDFYRDLICKDARFRCRFYALIESLYIRIEVSHNGAFNLFETIWIFSNTAL